MGKTAEIKRKVGGVFLRTRIKLRERTNPWFSPFRRKHLKYKDFTIISNNCWAGHVYRYFGLPYLTPTVGLYFFAEDYIKFVSNLKYYMSLDLKFIHISESKREKELYEHGGKSTTCPIGVLDDIEIIFLHYKTEQEARNKWMRRKERINWDNLYIKMSQMNDCTEDMLHEFDKIPCKNKFVFVKREYGIKAEVVYKGYENDSEIRNDTNYFRKYINVTNWLNGLPFRKN